jgi:hypothetical protein
MIFPVACRKKLGGLFTFILDGPQVKNRQTVHFVKNQLLSK